MKVVFKLLAVSLLVSVTGLAGCATKPSSNPTPSPNPDKVKSISLILPPLAKVTLKGGEEQSAYLSAVNQEEKAIELELGGEFRKISFDNIDRITFKEDNNNSRSNSKPPIRGEDNEDLAKKCAEDENPAKALCNLEINKIEFKPEEDKLNIKSLAQNKLEGMRQLSSDFSLVVKEIEFQSSEEVDIYLDSIPK